MWACCPALCSPLKFDFEVSSSFFKVAWHAGAHVSCRLFTFLLRLEISAHATAEPLLHVNCSKNCVFLFAKFVAFHCKSRTSILVLCVCFWSLYNPCAVLLGSSSRGINFETTVQPFVMTENVDYRRGKLINYFFLHLCLTECWPRATIKFKLSG